jgi:sterol desaturase/sphingolipid hydroxylase (fatty acid hydroxylase superfamily)
MIGSKFSHVGALGHLTRGFIVITVLGVVVEISWRLVRGRGYDGKEAGATLGVAAGNLLFGAVTGLAIGAVYALVWRFAPVRLPMSDWRTWVAGFVVVEFAYYWFHRASHEVRWMWASHAVHHTPEQMTLLSAIRLGWTNLFSGGWLFYAPVVLAGFDPRLVLALLAFDLHYQFFLHTEAVGKLGPLEWVLNTPSHHRVHHGSNASYLDRNYGGMVIVFDRMFGTFAKERAEEPVIYGLVHPLGVKNPIALALGEWRRLLSDMWRSGGVRSAAHIALGRPGRSIGP